VRSDAERGSNIQEEKGSEKVSPVTPQRLNQAALFAKSPSRNVSCKALSFLR
jgi:hypothetical protein